MNQRMGERPQPINQLDAFTDVGLSRIRISAIDGRELQSEHGTLIDYCTTNYLGFDFHPLMHEIGSRYAQEWGSLSGWSRLEADAPIYSDTEERICKFLGVKETILAHTITITNFSVMSAIAGRGVVICDSKVHSVVYESARLARDHGATLCRFKHQNMSDLRAKLEENKGAESIVIAVDGVYSVSTEQAPILEMQKLAKEFGAWLYVDDAHGFGILGRRLSSSSDYGLGGRGIIDHHGGNYARTFYVSSFGKAFCTHSAFITIPDEYNISLRERCMQYIFSAPMPPYVLGLVNAAMDLNEAEGDRRRATLFELCEQFVSGLRAMNLDISNEAGFPVVFWKVGEQDRTIKIAQALLKGGVLAGLRAFPVVPPTECGFRFGLTALHTKEHVKKTLRVISELTRESTT
ncbi:pyridoxal phosphate-dependent aminotransferase family protein [soil metagenome]